MKNETKSVYYHFRLTPTMKEKLFSRAAELHKDPSSYLLSLLEKDIAGYDLIETEKPRMKEFSRNVASELFAMFGERIDKTYMKTKSREEKIFVLMLLNYRQMLYQYKNIINHHEMTNKLSDEQKESCEEKSRKELNEIFEKYLEFVLSSDNDQIVSLLKQPV